LTVVPGAYLGRAGDSDVLVAVVPEGQTVRVYACDGKDLSNATVNQWFQGPLAGDGSATLAANGYRVTLRATGGGYSGEFAFPDGRALPFTATPAPAGSALLDAELRDQATGAIIRDGNIIVLGAEQRGVMIPTRPPKCRLVLVTGSGGQQQWVAVC